MKPRKFFVFVLTILIAEAWCFWEAVIDLVINGLVWCVERVAERSASPRVAVRWLKVTSGWLCFVLRRRRCSVVVPGQGRCVGIEVPDYATLLKRPRAAPAVVCFRGVPYARWAGRFEAPAPLLPLAPDTDPARVTANPVCWKPSFRVGTPGTLTPQPWRLGIDTPIFMTTPKVLAQFKLGKGYVGDEEQCLQLNIWCPSPSHPRSSAEDLSCPSKKLHPVLFFLHGGGFVFGSAHQQLTDGTNFVRESNSTAIVVSVNYRLGILGWAHVRGKTRNCGLHDMLAALRWVKKNINHFGGDPDNVTLAGQSAGAMAIGALLGVEALYSERLVHKVVMMSGTGHYTHSVRQQRDTLDDIAAEVGVAPGNDAQLAHVLCAMSVKDIIALQMRVVVRYVKKTKQNIGVEKVLPFMPQFAAGDPLLPQHPEAYLLLRKVRGEFLIPVLIGSTNAEFSFFSSLSRRHAPQLQLLKPRISYLLAAVGGHSFDTDGEGESTSTMPMSVNNSDNPRKHRGTEALTHAAPLSPSADASAADVLSAYTNSSYVTHRLKTQSPLWDAVHTDWIFRLPSERLADLLAATDVSTLFPPQTRDADLEALGIRLRGHHHHVPPRPPSTAPAFVYRFQHRSPLFSLDALHIIDLHYFFGNWCCPPFLTGGYSSVWRANSRAVMFELLVFVRTPLGDLAQLEVDDPQRWRCWDPQIRPVKVFDERPTAVTSNDGGVDCCGESEAACDDDDDGAACHGEQMRNNTPSPKRRLWSLGARVLRALGARNDVPLGEIRIEVPLHQEMSNPDGSAWRRAMAHVAAALTRHGSALPYAPQEQSPL